MFPGVHLSSKKVVARARLDAITETLTVGSDSGGIRGLSSRIKDHETDEGWIQLRGCKDQSLRWQVLPWFCKRYDESALRTMSRAHMARAKV